MTADVPRAKLSELVGRYGRGLSQDARRCKALLADVCNDQYRAECAVLVVAVDEGVPGELLGSSSGLPTAVLLGRLSSRLHTNRGVADELARWSVETWAVALGVAADADTLAKFKMDGLVPLIDLAGADGEITDVRLDHLIAEAATRGVSKADSRAYISAHALARGWQVASPQRQRQQAASSSSSQQAPPQLQPAQPAPAPHPAHGRTFRYAFVGMAVVITIAAIVMFARPISQPSVPSTAPSEAPKPRPSPDQATREQRIYDDARGDAAALRTYLGSCSICTYASAARTEIARVEAADRERHVYNAARGNLSALYAYVNSCSICAYAPAARSEINGLERPPAPCGGNSDAQVVRPIEQLYRAVNHRDLDLYAQQWDDRATSRDVFAGGGERTKTQKVETKRSQFAKWQFNLTMDRPPEILRRTETQAEVNVYYSISITFAPGECKRRTGVLERYTLTCGDNDRWQIIDNSDEINVSGSASRC